jgi:recombinational DNA repair protein (RecF pathway)
LVTQTTESAVPLPEIFSLLATFLEHLTRHQSHPLLPLAFELKLLAALGQQPSLDDLRLSPESRQTAEDCITFEWQDLASRPKAQINELDAVLRKFLEFHLGRTLDQRAAALAMGM